ncbi:hypothetical protein Tco_0320321 [Tanacetum coccineum]
MAQPQRQADVHQDELCPPNKRYALMDANKKIDLDNPLCPNESKIMANILQNHPLRFSIAASSSVPWIYLGQFWHTLKEDGSKYRLKFVLDRKEITMNLNDFRRIFQLPVHDKYHNLEDDEMVKSIFNLGKNKAGVGMKISSWMITDEMKLTENYWMYVAVFEVDVPATQSQPIESIQGTHRTTSAPRLPNPDVDEGESCAQRNIAEQKSRDDLEAKQNEEKVKEHLMVEEIEKLVEGTENVREDEVDNSILNSQNDPDTRLEPRSYKETLEVEKTVVVSQPVNVIKEEDESAENDYKLKRREKGKNVEEFLARQKFNVLAQHLQEVMEESLPKMVDDRVKELTKTQVPIYVVEGLITERQQNQADMAKIIADAIQKERENLRAKISSQINNAITNHIPSQDDPYDDAHHEGENSAKRQKTSEHGTYVFGESSSGQVNESEPGPSTSGNQEKLDDFNFWTNTYATDDDKLPAEKVSQELVEEMSEIVDEAKLHKVPTLVIQSCQRDPKSLALSLVNQDLLYLKKGNSGPEKIVLSLHKFHAIIFPDDNIEERTSRWVDDYIETGLLWSLLVFIRSLVIWERVHAFQLGVESYQQKVNLTAPTITFPSIEKYKMFSIISGPVYGIIYKNNKKEKRVMRHQEIHKFYDATLKRVLEGLKSYNNDVKHGYVTLSLGKEDVEYLQLFEEEIKEWLKHRDQMRC